MQLSPEEIATSRIMIVDDDELVTSSLSGFFALELDVDPVVFNSATAAAEYLAENDVDLVISDFLMPEMNGIELLTKAREAQPHVPRILLTGYADKENAIRAINDVGVFQYIEKPWENDRLKGSVIDALTKLVALRQLTDEIDELQGDTDFISLREALLHTMD
ncbi:MAG: response regulator [Deltaproteobacteria bacterium]|nr:response regulator [Deltaproteobacteria bacterium]